MKLSDWQKRHDMMSMVRAFCALKNVVVIMTVISVITIAITTVYLSKGFFL